MIDQQFFRGRVVADPTYRALQTGAVTEFRIAQSDSRQNEQGDWEDSSKLFVSVKIFDDNPRYKRYPRDWAAMAADLRKGQHVGVWGKLVTEQWDQNGETRSRLVFRASELWVHPENYVSHAQQSQGGWGVAAQQQPPQQRNTHWPDNPPPQQQQPVQQQQGVWGNPAPTGQAVEQPPF